MNREQLTELAKQLTLRRKLIEAGWIGLRIASIHPDASADQLDEMRTAFFAGAQHVFASIMNMLDPGDEPSEADLRRMDDISSELEAFIADYKLRHGVDVQGHA